MHDSRTPDTFRGDGKQPELASRHPFERGQDAVEYALIVVLVALAITASMLMLAKNVDQSYDDASACVTGTTLAGASPAGGPTSPARGKAKGKGRGKGLSQGGTANPCP